VGQTTLAQQIQSTDSPARAQAIVKTLLSSGWSVTETMDTAIKATRTAYRDRYGAAMFAAFSVMQVLFAQPHAAKVPVAALKSRDRITTTVTIEFNPTTSGTEIKLLFVLSGERVLPLQSFAADYHVVKDLVNGLSMRLLEAHT